MNKRFLVALLVFRVIFSFGTSQAFGQAVYGSVFGTVTDPSGARGCQRQGNGHFIHKATSVKPHPMKAATTASPFGPRYLQR